VEPRRARSPRPSHAEGREELASAGVGEAPTTEECTLTVHSRPWSEIWLDEKNTGHRTPLIGFKIGCGRHTLLVRREDLALSQVERIEAAPGATVLRTIILR
jgi:hypothetical protein